MVDCRSRTRAPTCRAFWLLLLVLIQSIAPLVHAHVDYRYPAAPASLHLPGLENHAADTQSLACLAENPTHDRELAIGIDPGMETGNRMALVLLDTLWFSFNDRLSPVLKPPHRPVSGYPPPAPSTPTWHTHSQAPRAPPTHRAATISSS